MGFSAVSIASKKEVKIDLKGMEASTNCFFVVVGGKYLRLIDEVMDIVDNVTEDVGRSPLAVFYVTNDEKITTFYDQLFHLPLVINLRYININPIVAGGTICQHPFLEGYFSIKKRS